MLRLVVAPRLASPQVLPLLPCTLAPCAPRVPNPLRSSVVMISFGDLSACPRTLVRASSGDRAQTWHRSGGSNGSGIEQQLLSCSDLSLRATEAPLGWSPSPNTSSWWWRTGRKAAGHSSSGCCQLIPTYTPYVAPHQISRTLSLRKNPVAEPFIVPPFPVCGCILALLLVHSTSMSVALVTLGTCCFLFRCVDASGARRPLSDEPILSMADLGRFLKEVGQSLSASPSRPLATHSSLPLALPKGRT